MSITQLLQADSSKALGVLEPYKFRWLNLGFLQRSLPAFQNKGFPEALLKGFL